MILRLLRDAFQLLEAIHVKLSNLSQVDSFDDWFSIESFKLSLRVDVPTLTGKHFY